MQLFNYPTKSLYLILALLEVLLIGAACQLGIDLRMATAPERMEPMLAPVWQPTLLYAGVMSIGLVSVGLYNRRLRDGLPGVVVRLVLGITLAATALSVMFYIMPPLRMDRGAFLLALLSTFALLVIVRMFFMDLLEQQNIRLRVLVLGAGRHARALAMLRRRSDLIGFDVVGYVPMPGDSVQVSEDKLLHAQPSLEALVDRVRADVIVVAADDRRGTLPMAELVGCRTRGLEVVDLLTFLEQETGKINLDVMYPGWLAFSRGFRRGVLREWTKRGFDVAVSLVLLVMTLPITVTTVIAISAESRGRGGVFYRQVRVGEGGREFPVYKFRSMQPDAESDGKARWARPGDDRVTRVGRFIRKYRIDELPQLINILRGDMSFVGPRPERPEFVGRLAQSLPYYPERHRVKPGLTGWAQVCYPYGASDQDAFEKLKFDLYYVKNHSLLLDLTVMLHTAEVVLWGKGAR